MSSIVVLSSFYLGAPSANGICARNLMESLRSDGHEVAVVCYETAGFSNEAETESIYTIPQPASAVTHNCIERVVRTARVLLGSTKPILARNTVSDFLTKLEEIHKKKKIDAVVAMFFPLETVEAMCRFKATNDGVKTIIFELDSIGDGVSGSRVNILYNRAYKRWLDKCYQIVSKTVIMQSHKQYWLRLFGKKNHNRLVVSDLPVLLDKTARERNENKVIKMVYSGAIEKRYRSPFYLLSVLGNLEKSIAFEFFFFSKGDCEDAIAEAAKSIRGIRQCGYVKTEELEKVMVDADILVSIGNSYSNSVPSKLIAYLGYGKSIIHFSSQKEDVCKQYLAKYPLALIIDQSKEVEENAKAIVDFIKTVQGSTVDYDTVKKLFVKNVPSYSASIIKDTIEGRDMDFGK